MSGPATTEADMEGETSIYGGISREAIRQAALTVLRYELKAFECEGLTDLHRDLNLRIVARGAWEGCPLSYRRGSACSARRDSEGHARNEFTYAWDHGFVSNEDTIDAVEKETLRRQSELYGEAAGRTEDVAETVAA